MYAVSVLADFVAQHYLTVPNPGPEGVAHSHRYELEVEFRGPELNEYDYLVDIDDVEVALEDVRDRYADELLNDLPEFEGDNPSVERFSRVIWERVTEQVTDDTIETVTVTVWEDEEAYAAYEASVR
jgi:6-pyruvoyltetrahydropterin/6-carboxytetrahydropterin synthase